MLQEKWPSKDFVELFCCCGVSVLSLLVLFFAPNTSYAWPISWIYFPQFNEAARVFRRIRRTVAVRKSRLDLA